MPHSTIAGTKKIDGHEVDVASLETINFGRMAAKEPTEGEKLLTACQMPGFFYLDLQNGSAKDLVADLPEILAATKTYFAEPQEVKMKDYRSGQERGLVDTRYIHA
jgi:isopenicillin N synthase-like dioxygenase